MNIPSLSFRVPAWLEDEIRGRAGSFAAGRHAARRLSTVLSACLLAGWLAGCASPSGSPPAGVASLPVVADAGSTGQVGPAFCFNFFEALEGRIRGRQLLDAGEQRVGGHAYLRSNRFLASFAADFSQQLDQAEAASQGEADAAASLLASAPFRAWIERMRQLDAHVRHFEIARLPDDALPLYQYADRSALQAEVVRCGQVLARQLQPADVPGLLRQVQVPDEYERLLRALGAYPVTGMGVASSIRNWEAHQREVFSEQRTATFSGQAAFQRYRPPVLLDGAEARRQAAAVMAGVARDALGIPLLSGEQLAVLARAYAPSYDVATINDADRIGRLRWIDLDGLVNDREDRFWLDVDTNVPVVYQRLEFTRFNGQVLPQLVYTVWFSERPKASRSDLQAGRLDGLVWRVTLDGDGAPLAYDSIQPSGRYAMFFPSRRLVADPVSASQVEPLVEWLYSPIDVAVEDWSGLTWPAGLSLRVGSGTHQLVGFSAPGEQWGTPVFDNPPYTLVDEEGLRALPLPDGGSRSIYDQSGFIPGTERLGRWLLWTTGLRNMGAMRQPGRQPTALIGRRHFDDPYLFQQRFRRVPVPQP